MAPVTPRELPVTRYLELPTSDAHPPRLPSQTVPGGRTWPIPSQLQEDDSRRTQSEEEMEVGSKAEKVGTANSETSDAPTL